MDLNIDPSAVRANANRLQSAADSFRSEIQNLYSQVDDIQPNTPHHVWWGQSATNFVNNVNDLKPDFEAIIAKLEEYVNWLNNAAQNGEAIDQ